MRTDRENHEVFLNALREREKSLWIEFNRAKYGLDSIHELIAKEEAYLAKEPPCAPSSPNASAKPPTAT